MADNYGPGFQDHLLEQYKLYVQMADHISQRRALANTFFLALHTGLLGAGVGLAGLSSSSFELVVATMFIAVIDVCFAAVWIRILKTYRSLNTVKFQVICELEVNLPTNPYTVESKKLVEAKEQGYKGLTETEDWVPTVFLYGFLVAIPLVGWLLWIRLDL